MSEPLASVTMCRQEAILQSVSQRNAAFFEAEANKLDGWAEDLKVGLEREIKELDRQIREARRAATAAPTLPEKLEAQKYVKSLEAHRNTRRRALFDAQDDIDRHREQLIADIEGKLGQKTTLQELFSIRWKII
jgi:adenine-specific DNA-methyltransferase